MKLAGNTFIKQLIPIIFILIIMTIPFFGCLKKTGRIEIPMTIYTAQSTAGDADEGINIILTGDTMLSRNVEQLCRDRNDFDYPFSRISDAIKSADIAFTNLETPLTGGNSLMRGLVFRGDPRFGAALRRAGFTIVSLANNHILDQGISGLQQTAGILEKSGISFSGADAVSLSHKGVVIAAGGCRVGFLSFTDTLNSLRISDYARDGIINYNDTERITAAVRDMRSRADIVIVSLHWGRELYPEPSERQLDLAASLTSAGADIIAGHHPHVIQPYKRINGGHVFFSLGNFVFDQTSKPETSRALMVSVLVKKKSIHRVRVFPLSIDMEYRPGISIERDAREIYDAALSSL